MIQKYIATIVGLLWTVNAFGAIAAFSESVTLAPQMAFSEAAAAKQLLGNGFRCTFRSVEKRHGRQTILLGGSTANTLAVDQSTGIVVEYTPTIYTALENKASGSPFLTADDAVGRAVAFLQKTGILLDGLWTLTDKTYQEHGTGDRDYDITWRKVFQGVELASFINVVVDADDGQIKIYMLIDDPVTIPLLLNLTGEQALNIVAEKKGWGNPVVKKANLQVWYAGGYPGPQALMWRFEVANPDAKTGSDSYVWADVNATTGEIISLGEPGGFFRMPKEKKMVSVALPKINVKALRHAKLPPTVFQAARKKAK
jgi:hypothetical protein